MLPTPVEKVSERYPKFHKASLVRFKVPIQKYNTVDTKHALEQGIRDAFVLEFGWKEDHTLLERHLFLGYIAAIASISSAVYGYTHEFNHDTKVILVIGAAIYYVFTTLTFLQNQFIKKDIVFKGKKTSGLEPESLTVHLVQKSYSDQVDITVALVKGKGPAKTFPISRSVGRYFTEKGEFVSSTFMADVQSIVDAFGSKKEN